MERSFSKIKSRILNHIDVQGISRRDFYKRTRMPNGTLNVSSGITEGNIEKYLSTYPEISPEWLLTGKGSMFRLVHREDSTKHAQILEEPQAVYGKPQEIKPTTCATCDEKERVIQGLKSQLEEVRYRLVDKDKQIEDLKSNMALVISEKSEVIKMKDEMLLMKDRMLEIQAEKIAELEGLNKRQTKEAGKQKSA